MSGRRGYVYLLHFDGRINPDHACRHYLGFTQDLRERIEQHRAGGSTAARLLQVAAERGIGFTVARVWKGDRGLERLIKRQKHTPDYCPVCGGRRWVDFADELPPAEVERLTGPAGLFSWMVVPAAIFPDLAYQLTGGIGKPIPLNGLSLFGLFLIALAMVLALRQMIAALRRGQGGGPMG